MEIFAENVGNSRATLKLRSELSLQAQTEIPRSALRAVMALRATHPR